MSTEPLSARTRSERLPAGAGTNAWIAFAGILLFLNGCFGALYGLAAILNDDVVTVGGGTGVTIWDFTAWGWIHLVLGVVMMLVSVGLFTGMGAARWLAIGFAMLNALAQFAIISAFPLWGILLIVLDVVIIYQLIVRWDPEA
ncbi:MAG TPA: hypothetical protein VGM33_12560 [Baekduia sp.]|jgi:hypothetical protein